jgi:WYL domain
MRLIETISNLIVEQASLGDCIDAIKNRKVLIIYYDGDEPGGKGLREIEPVCLGTSKAGNKLLRAWDKEGSTHTGYIGSQPLPGWRLFRLDKILTIKPTGEIYNEPRPDYNFDGDRTMVSVIVNAKFDGVETIDNIISTQLTQIVTTILTQLITDTIKRRGVDAIKGADFTKAAEFFNRLYKDISTKINRILTPEDKQKIKTEAVKIVSQIQNKLIQDITKKS